MRHAVARPQRQQVPEEADDRPEAAMVLFILR